jgi:hypothetical protein
MKSTWREFTGDLFHSRWNAHQVGLQELQERDTMALGAAISEAWQTHAAGHIDTALDRALD